MEMSDDIPLLQTVDQFLTTCDPAHGWTELARGRVVVRPWPTFRHALVKSNVGFAIRAHLNGAKIGRVAFSSGVITERDPDTVRGPDVSFYSAERLPFGVEVIAYHDLPPDLCVEVKSPSETKSGLRDKAHEYLTGGVKLVWIVDPDARTVTIYESKIKSTVLEAEAILTAESVLPGFSCVVSDFFNG
jgi:Uma2 family endonuclease